MASKPYKAGDLIFFSGRQWWPSRFIAFITWSWRLWVSHVAIVVDWESEPRLLESTTIDSVPCLVTGERVKGVQLHEIEERIAAYPGRVYVARLIDEQKLNWVEKKKLTRMALKVIGTPYSEVGAFLAGTNFIKRAWWFYGKLNITYCSGLCEWLLKNVDRWDWQHVRSSPARMARIAAEEGRWNPLERIK